MALFLIDNQPSDIDWKCDSDILRRTLQNAKNLLMCRMGEVPYDRMRGLDPAIFDMPMTELDDVLMPELDRVFAWEPDVEVESAEASLLEDGSTLIEVTLDIRVGEAAEEG